MGCFDVTCRLTNTAISSGEECVLIILENDYPSNFHDLTNLVYQKTQSKNRDGLEFPIKEVVVGEYNDYGSLENKSILPDDFEDKYSENVLFFHTWAIEFIFGDKIENLIKDKINFVSELFSKISLLRKAPLDLLFIGQQHKDVEEMENMINLNNRINVYLKNKIKEYKKNGWAG